MQVFGHRGAAGEAPENTIAGCKHAIERGVQRIEIDLQLSADGQLVVVHDTTVNRTTGAWGRVRDFTAKELYKLNATAAGPLWPGKRQVGIPTLDKLLRATAALKQYQLEVKPGNQRDMHAIAEQLAQRFANKRQAKSVVVTSSNSKLLQRLHELAPHIQRGLVASGKADLDRARRLNLEYFCCHWRLCNAFTVRKAREAGMHVSVWTVNEPALIRKLHALGVDSVISDYPSMALPLVSALQRPTPEQSPD